MSIIWDDTLKTGIPTIDEQHQFIVETLSGIKISKLKKRRALSNIDELTGLSLNSFQCRRRLHG